MRKGSLVFLVDSVPSSLPGGTPLGLQRSRRNTTPLVHPFRREPRVIAGFLLPSDGRPSLSADQRCSRSVQPWGSLIFPDLRAKWPPDSRTPREHTAFLSRSKCWTHCVPEKSTSPMSFAGGVGDADPRESVAGGSFFVNPTTGVSVLPPVARW